MTTTLNARDARTLELADKYAQRARNALRPNQTAERRNLIAHLSAKPSGAERAETYNQLCQLWNAFSAVDTAACMLPTFKVTHEGGIEAAAKNIVEAIKALAAGEEVKARDAAHNSEQWARARKLLVRIYERHPETRSLIEDSTGNWFVWGIDRDAPASQREPIPAAGEVKP